MVNSLEYYTIARHTYW